MRKREVFLAVTLVVGVSYGIYRFATWEVNNTTEEIIRNICIPWALALLAIRGILAIPDDPKS